MSVWRRAQTTIGRLGRYSRRLEAPYATSKYVYEFYNTISNVPFVVIGWIRMVESVGRTPSWHLDAIGCREEDVLPATRMFIHDISRLHLCILYLYLFYMGMGLASGIHHAVRFHGSLVVDWIPILCTFVCLLLHFHLLHDYLLAKVSMAVVFQLVLAVGVLVMDHVCPLVPVPWGHVVWHLLAALSIDSLYQSFQMELSHLRDLRMC